jgi:hypothetical protein
VENGGPASAASNEDVSCILNEEVLCETLDGLVEVLDLHVTTTV